MLRCTVQDRKTGYYFEQIMNCWHGIGYKFRDADGDECKVVSVEGKVFMGKRD